MQEMSIIANHWERRARIEMKMRDPVARRRFIKIRTKFGRNALPSGFMIRRNDYIK
jgi:hypothetical protein